MLDAMEAAEAQYDAQKRPGPLLSLTLRCECAEKSRSPVGHAQ